MTGLKTMMIWPPISLRHRLAWLLAAAILVVPWASRDASSQTPSPGKADGTGGLADLSTEDVEALREVRETLKRIAVDPREHSDDQRRALLALGRVHEALNDWGLDDHLAWCLEAMSSAKRNKDVLASLAVAAAKGGACHLGGVHGLWSRLEHEEGVIEAPEWRKRRAVFQRLVSELPKRAPRLSEALRPMNLQAKTVDPKTLRTVTLTSKSIDLKGMLTPYKP